MTSLNKSETSIPNVMFWMTFLRADRQALASFLARAFLRRDLVEKEFIQNKHIIIIQSPSRQNRPKKAVCRSVFLTLWHYILSAELTKSHSLQTVFLAIFPTGLFEKNWLILFEEEFKNYLEVYLHRNSFTISL